MKKDKPVEINTDDNKSGTVLIDDGFDIPIIATQLNSLKQNIGNSSIVVLEPVKEFLVVYEDLWNNKENVRTTRIGDAIKQFVEDYDLIHEEEIDYDKYNSDEPYDVGTTGLGFFDIWFEDEHGESAGRIMIFDL